MATGSYFSIITLNVNGLNAPTKRQRTDSFEKTLMLGKSEGRRKRGQQRMR